MFRSSNDCDRWQNLVNKYTEGMSNMTGHTNGLSHKLIYSQVWLLISQHDLLNKLAVQIIVWVHQNESVNENSVFQRV